MTKAKPDDNSRIYLILIALLVVCWLTHEAISSGLATPWSPLGQHNNPAPTQRFHAPDNAPAPATKVAPETQEV